MSITREVSIVIPTYNRDYSNLVKSIERDNFAWIRQIIIQKDELGEGCPKTFNKWVEKARFDWIVFLWDDCLVEWDWLNNAFKEQGQSWKLLIAFNDWPLLPDRWNDCCEFMIHKSLVEKLEYKQIFNEDFYHVGCDNWLSTQAKKLNEYHYAESARIIHNHYSKWAEFDTCYQKGWQSDRVKHDRIVLSTKLNKF